MHMRIVSIAVVVMACLAISLSGCAGGASNSTASSTSEIAVSSSSDANLPDGDYTVEVDTDSSMFHVNEANDNTGTLSVADGKMTVHISLVSKKILNLYPGTADEASQPGADLLEPTVDTVTYKDGYQEEVYGFDIPVPALDEEFDVAILGEKGKWYDHKVSVSQPVL